MRRLRYGFVFLLLALLMPAPPVLMAATGATVATTTATHRTKRSAKVQKSAQKRAQTRAQTRARLARVRHRRHRAAAHVVRTKKTVVKRRVSTRHTGLHSRRHRYYERFTANSYSDDNTVGDVTAGEDPMVRQAAIQALGNMNGTVVVINPQNGRILAMVNQKLALSSGAEPCSTIKLSVALAALEEGIITKDTPVNLGGRYRVNLTEALAHSNNLYFETVGRALGFDRVKHYANEFGLGELAGYHIAGEHLGEYPDKVLPTKMGGVGRMCSFGESVSMTPLQLGALVSAIANGGTLYYLQHPTTPQEVAAFQPRIKRQLNIGPLIPEIQVGMHAVVQYGTARSLRTNFNEFPVMGKTGTCSNDGTRYGWFASYADSPAGPIVTVFFLEGGRPTFGPKAAELTGIFYRQLWSNSYFAARSPSHTETDGAVVGLSQ